MLWSSNRKVSVPLLPLTVSAKGSEARDSFRQISKFRAELAAQDFNLTVLFFTEQSEPAYEGI